MVVNMNEISDMMFKHIENRNMFPIEKLKLMIEKYKTQVSEDMVVKNARVQHIVEYMNTKSINDEIYNQFVLDRAELMKRWKAEKTKDLLQDLVKMRYTPPDIPDIFGKIERQPVVSGDDERPIKKHRVIANEKETKADDNEVKPKKTNKTKKSSSEPWFSKNADKLFNTDKAFWDKTKSILVKSPNYLQPYDTDDVESVEDGLLTSASINIFANSVLESSKESSKYIIFPAEFYYQIEDIIGDDDAMNTLMESEMFSNIGDDWMNKIIIIPTNLDNVHWIISIINPYEGKIYVIDPYDKKNENVYNTISKWREISLSKYPQVSNKVFEPVYSIPNIPTQEADDTENCGVFISMYVMYFMNSGKFPSNDNFSTDDTGMIRKHMLRVITKYSKENKTKPPKECPPGQILNQKGNRCIKDKKLGKL